MAEDVDEQFSAGLEPARDACQQRFVVSHVLEHLDRDAAVELPGIKIEPVHVAGDYPHMIPATRSHRCASMWARCVLELDTAVILAFG